MFARELFSFGFTIFFSSLNLCRSDRLPANKNELNVSTFPPEVERRTFASRDLLVRNLNGVFHVRRTFSLIGRLPFAHGDVPEQKSTVKTLRIRVAGISLECATHTQTAGARTTSYGDPILFRKSRVMENNTIWTIIKNLPKRSGIDFIISNSTHHPRGYVSKKNLRILSSPWDFAIRGSGNYTNKNV